MCPMAFAPDHVVVVVGSLAEATRAFAAAGFTVTPGGRHDALPSENALVAFADGAYLELLALRESGARAGLREAAAGPGWERHLAGLSAVARRFLPVLAGADGVRDFALRGGDLPGFAARARRAGVAVAGPVAMERVRPDGVRLAWTLALPAPYALPFVIADRTPRAGRVPGGPAATAHANGTRGVAEVRVRTPDVAGTAFLYADLFGASLAALPDGATRLGLGDFAVALEAGEPAGAC